MKKITSTGSSCVNVTSRPKNGRPTWCRPVTSSVSTYLRLTLLLKMNRYTEVVGYLGDADGGKRVCFSRGKIQLILRNKEVIHVVHDFIRYNILCARRKKQELLWFKSDSFEEENNAPSQSPSHRKASMMSCPSNRTISLIWLGKLSYILGFNV